MKDLLQGPLDGADEGELDLLVRPSPGRQVAAFGLHLQLTEHVQDALTVGHGISACGEPVQHFL
jgi:hypothetical protein